MVALGGGKMAMEGLRDYGARAAMVNSSSLAVTQTTTDPGLPCRAAAAIRQSGVGASGVSLTQAPPSGSCRERDNDSSEYPPPRPGVCGQPPFNRSGLAIVARTCGLDSGPISLPRSHPCCMVMPPQLPSCRTSSATALKEDIIAKRGDSIIRRDTD
jgi:hypothetical protein